MAKVEKQEEPKKPSVKSKEFKLKRAYQGRAVGETIKAGPEGERVLKSKNVI